MEELSLHILDIAENSASAGAKRVEISIKEDVKGGRLSLVIEDDGKGIDMRKLSDPYYTEKSCKRMGLGIPFLEQAARECGGSLSVGKREPTGTKLQAEFQLSHVDLKPMGDVGSTMATLVCGHPEMDFAIKYERDGTAFGLDTGALRLELEGMPLNVPQVLKYIKDEINNGIGRIKG